MSSNVVQPSRRAKAGIVLLVLFGPIFAEVIWQYAHEIEALARFTALEFALIAAVGGAMAGLLIGQTRATRLIGMVTGALATFGCHFAFNLVYGSSARAGGERFFVFLGGALPGLLVGLALVYLVDKSAKARVADTPPAGS